MTFFGTVVEIDFRIPPVVDVHDRSARTSVNYQHNGPMVINPVFRSIAAVVRFLNRRNSPGDNSSTDRLPRHGPSRVERSATQEAAVILGLGLLLVAPIAAQALRGNAMEIKARISLPYEDSLVRANVPVFGVAWAAEFESYRLEFGEGREPKKWILINESKQPEPEDPWSKGKVVWNRDWGAIKGNLGRWEVGLDEYPYGQVFKHAWLTGWSRKGYGI